MDETQKEYKMQEPMDKKAAREERVREVKEKYGFTLWKKPKTPEEIEGHARYLRDLKAAKRERRKEHLRNYYRKYYRKRRAKALAIAQEKWTSEQWAEYEKSLDRKTYPPGSPQWLVREVVRYLAVVQDISEEAVTARLIECGGLDFLTKGAESLGEKNCGKRSMVIAAVRALALFLDPERAVMFTNATKSPGMSDQR